MTTIDTPARPLENGWRSTTPDGDNLLLDFARTEAAAAAVIGRSAGGHAAAVHDLGLFMSDAGSPCPFGNIAHLTRPLDRAEAERLAGALHDFYGARDGGPLLLFSPFPTADLHPFGFGLAGHPPFMVRPGGTAAPEHHGVPHAPGLDIVEVRTAAALADFERTMIDAYPAPELAPFGSGPRLYGDDVLGSAWRLFVGYLDGEPVATAGSFAGNRVAIVEAVATRQECRGRGYGAALTAASVAAAPGVPAALIASDPGRNVYEGLGFMPVTRYTLWVGRRRFSGG
jgi:GNAT superfamily N-acetyltransferase